MLTVKNVITINLIIINLFIEGSLISAQALFYLGTLFGATWIHLNLELGCGSVTYKYTCAFYLCPIGPRTSCWGVNID